MGHPRRSVAILSHAWRRVPPPKHVESLRYELGTSLAFTTKVKSAIFNDASLKVNEINVETFKGVVQLSGFVRSQADIDQAMKVARGVADVKSVKNDMRIK